MKIEKKIRILIMISLLCMGAVACNNPMYTAKHEHMEITPTPTIAPTLTVTPTNVMEDEVAISEENFGDPRFCLYLKEKYDTDRNGLFSEKELEKVKEILIGFRSLIEPYSELKGFSYFPELERLELSEAYQVEICDVQKLSVIEMQGRTSVQSCRLGNVTIENCPELQGIWLRDMTVVVKQGTEASEFIVENCPKLETLSIAGKGMNPLENMVIRVSGTPKLLNSFFNAWPGAVELDTSVFQKMELPIVDIKNKKLDTSGNHFIIWNGERVTEYDAALTELEEVILKLQEGFLVEVQEVIPALYDAEGRKAYQVLIDNKYLSGEYYGINDVRLGYYGDYENDAFVLYSEKPLTEEDFTFEWQELLTMPVSKYAPLGGFYGSFCGTIPGDSDDARHGFAGNLFYRNGENKEYYGEITVRMSYAITPEDGLLFWTKTEYNENREECYVQDGVRFTDTTENVTPEADELPITSEYFSNLIFRDYLKEWIDLDRNGYLSSEEREAVVLLNAGYYDMGPNVVDGLNNFPNLETICIGACEKLVCKDCPELRQIAVFGADPDDAIIREGAIEIVTENCPKLEDVWKNCYWDTFWDNYLENH